MAAVPPSPSDPSAPPGSESASPAQVIAAVDLGSNSFHMVVATLRHGQLTIVDRLRETVRLAEGLTRDGVLTEQAKRRALTALARFGDRLRDMRADNVRAAGTNALRRAGNDHRFVEQAEAVLGHPIEVISGIEEARLVYLGVAHSLPPYDGRRLVIDIGGGSTELIVGNGFETRDLQSLSMGAVMVTESFFPNGKLTKDSFDAAREMARLKLRPVKRAFRADADTQPIGTSGTILAAERLISASGIRPTGGIDVDSLEKLIKVLIDAGHARRIDLPGLSTRRAEVLAGGLAILVEVLIALRIKLLRTSDGALREGLLYDLVGRIHAEDARVATVAAMAGRYHVDLAHAETIAVTAEQLRQMAAPAWDLDDEQSRLMLCWAAYLHEIGLDIAHRDFHLHGAYIVANADMPGFPAVEQQCLAALIGAQRKALAIRDLGHLPKSRQTAMRRLAVLLRIALALHRSRSRKPLPEFDLDVHGSKLALRFPADFLASTPLTRADLGREARLLAQAGFSLDVDYTA
ncbi:MAG: Ppx/GppA phosphatase family protein [Pseudomonadota bacterium]